jgi:Uma2 family endonuclease
MGMPAIRHRWTPAQVRELIDKTPRHWPRYELIDGELVVTPSPAPPHQVAVSKLMELLIPYVKAERLGVVLTSPSDVELEPESITQPDVFVVPSGTFPETEFASWKQVTRLLLAIEVLSPASMESDRKWKRNLYLRNRVLEYWIVDLDAKVIEQWIPFRETPQILSESISWMPDAAANALTIDLPAFFEEIRQLSGLARRV